MYQIQMYIHDYQENHANIKQHLPTLTFFF